MKAKLCWTEKETDWPRRSNIGLVAHTQAKGSVGLVSFWEQARLWRKSVELKASDNQQAERLGGHEALFVPLTCERQALSPTYR